MFKNGKCWSHTKIASLCHNIRGCRGKAPYIVLSQGSILVGALGIGLLFFLFMSKINVEKSLFHVLFLV